MHIKSLFYAASAAALLALALPAAADDAARSYHGLTEQERQEVRERWAAMSPEERQAQREEMRERWQNMSAEEREAHRGMMRSQRADEVRKGGYGAGQGKAYGRDGKRDYADKGAKRAKDKDKDKAPTGQAAEPQGRY